MTGGTLDGWDDELDAWAHGDDAATYVQGQPADECTRPKPGDDYPDCTQGYDHTGHCDWFDAAYATVMATVNAHNQAAAS